MPKPSKEAKRKGGKKETTGSEDEFEFLNRDINGADFASLLDGSKDEAGGAGAVGCSDREIGADG